MFDEHDGVQLDQLEIRSWSRVVVPANALIFSNKSSRVEASTPSELLEVAFTGFADARVDAHAHLAQRLAQLIQTQRSLQ